MISADIYRVEFASRRRGTGEMIRSTRDDAEALLGRPELAKRRIRRSIGMQFTLLTISASAARFS